MEKIKQEQRVRAEEVCFRKWICHLTFGGVRFLPFGEIELRGVESDGRRRRALWRALVRDGFLAPVASTPDTPVHVRVTSRAFDLVEGSKPDLASRIPREANLADQSRVPAGVSWLPFGAPRDGLTPAERKWIVTHPQDYELLSWDPGRSASPILQAFGTASPAFPNLLLVRDAAFAARWKELVAEARLGDLLPGNLGWGLVELGLVSPADGDAFKGPSILGEPGLGRDPEKWGSDLDCCIEQLADAIARHRRRLDAMAALRHRMATYAGGWPAFLRAYRERLRAELEKGGG